MLRIFLFILILIASHNISKAQNTGVKTVEETCRVLATVIKTEQWLYAPYQNAPSTFSDIYTRLTLEIQDVQTFEKYRNAKDSFCQGIEKMSQQTYKPVSYTHLTLPPSDLV